MVVGWIGFMTSTQNWYLFKNNWFMTVTMILGSFVAGVGSEGGGAVGILFGSYYIVPLITSSYAKMMFVSFWLSFGMAL